MDDRCGLCGRELEPGSFPQLQFDGTWICEACVAAPPPPPPTPASREAGA